MENLSDILAALRKETGRRSEKLVSEFEVAWAAAVRLLEAQAESYALLGPDELESGRLSSIERLVRESGTTLLAEPVSAWKKSRPDRALKAIEAHSTAMADLPRRLPEMVHPSGAEVITAVGAQTISPVRRFLLGRRKTAFDLPLRSIAGEHFLHEDDQRAARDGEFCLLLAKASLMLLHPWQDLRHQALLALSGRQSGDEPVEARRNRWNENRMKLQRRGAQLLDEAKKWHAASDRRLSAAITHRRRRRPSMRWHSCFQLWSRQQRSVASLLELEVSTMQATAEIAAAGSDALVSLTGEHAELFAELNEVIGWLRERQSGQFAEDFPPATAHLISAAQRRKDWENLVRNAVHQHLSPSLEAVELRAALPPRRPPWLRLEPRDAFLSGLGAVGAGVQDGFQEAEAAHRAVVREIEKSREVVSFSIEAARSEPMDGPAILREGFENALNLTTYLKETTSDPADAVERKLVEGTAGLLLLGHLRLERGRLGALSQIARHRGSRARSEVWRLASAKIAGAGARTRDLIRGWYSGLLTAAGWETPPVAIAPPVDTRGYLGDTLNLWFGARNLPLIYRRLFRLAPVEEPRFLVGREEAMAALAQARSLWESNRAVSVVVVGARGSGKSSLLNCAIAGEFSGAEVVRGQFSDRVTDPAAMRGFLHRLFDIPDDQDLVASIRSKKRIVVLEEVERAFLRRINGFEGLHELLTIASDTAGSTLWVLCLNQHAYHFLDAATGLGQWFSHRINAMAVSPECLKNAILLRHNLSGLRLQYPPPPEGSPRLRAIRKLLGIERQAEAAFFEALYRQSEGIFRSAFEQWQNFMERVEGGVLYLDQPKEPDFEPLLAQMGLEDSLTLQAILQHGSLTEQDHSEIFECAIERSRMRIEKLLSLECVETDPGGPGLRVRPEAGRIVHIALHRLNLA